MSASVTPDTLGDWPGWLWFAVSLAFPALLWLDHHLRTRHTNAAAAPATEPVSPRALTTEEES